MRHTWLGRPNGLRRHRLYDAAAFYQRMQLAKIRVGTGFVEVVALNAAGIETF
jgi:hypothetical protein